MRRGDCGSGRIARGAAQQTEDTVLVGCARPVAGNFENELAPDGIGKCRRVVRRDDERPRSADDAIGKRGLEVVVDRAAGTMAAEHGKPVDGDAGGNDFVPRYFDWRAAGVGGAVGGKIDDAPEAFDVVSLDERFPEEERRADGIRSKRAARRGQQCRGKAVALSGPSISVQSTTTSCHAAWAHST